jgi:hypothetical protein
MIVVRGAKTTGNPWNVTAGNLSASTNTTGTLPGDTTTVDNCLIIGVAGDGLDQVAARYSDWANPDLANIQEIFDGGSTAGNGAGFGAISGEKAVAGAFGATTFTISASQYECNHVIAVEPEPGAAGAEYIDAGTVAVDIAPSGNDIHEQVDADTVRVAITPSAFEQRIGAVMARAIDVIDDGGYTDQAGSSTEAALLAAVDESTADDADYIRSPESPIAPAEIKFRLSPIEVPLEGSTHTLRYRYGKSSSDGDTINQVITLYAADGTTVIKQATHNNVGIGPIADQMVLSAGEVDSIPSADYATGLVVGIRTVKA